MARPPLPMPALAACLAFAPAVSFSQSPAGGARASAAEAAATPIRCTPVKKKKGEADPHWSKAGEDDCLPPPGAAGGSMWFVPGEGGRPPIILTVDRQNPGVFVSACPIWTFPDGGTGCFEYPDKKRPPIMLIQTDFLRFPYQIFGAGGRCPEGTKAKWDAPLAGDRTCVAKKAPATAGNADGKSLANKLDRQTAPAEKPQDGKLIKVRGTQERF